MSLSSGNARWEAAFSEEFIRNNFLQARVAVATGVVLIFGDVVIDIVLNNNVLLIGNEIWLFAILPLMSALFGVTFYRKFRSHYQTIVSIFLIPIIPAFALSLLSLDKSQWLGLTSYVGALNYMFLIVYIFLFLGLRIVNAIFVGLYTFIIFLIALAFDENHHQLSVATYFYHSLTVLLLGGVTGYIKELFIRRNFALQIDASAQREVSRQAFGLSGDSRDVFLCHSSVDANLATRVTNYLESAGVTCWQSEQDIIAGSAWREVIVYAISNCKVVLLLVSEFSTKSPEVVKEISLANRYLKPIVPVQIGSATVAGELAYEISHLHYLTVSDRPDDHEFAPIHSAVSAKLD